MLGEAWMGGERERKQKGAKSKRRRSAVPFENLKLGDLEAGATRSKKRDREKT